jgi:hypothetical protein
MIHRNTREFGTAYILYHQKVEEGPTTSTMGIILTLNF